jgi:hypothetical protein
MSKRMTCLQLGGPCDATHQGEDHNDIIKAQDRHLREAVKAGSSEHEPALAEMKARWRRPVSGLKWYRGVQRAFASLPEEA